MRCVGVAEIRFIKYFRDEGMGKSVEKHGCRGKPGRRRRCQDGSAHATPSQRRRRRHLQPARCGARRLPGFTIRQPFPSSPVPPRALAALQPQATCQAASPTDLQAAAARALFEPRGLAMSRQEIATRQHDHLLGPQSCVIV